MSIKNIMTSVTTAKARLGFKANKHAPTALVVTGIGALLASAVFAARDTHKVEPIIDQARRELDLIDLGDHDPRERAMEVTKVYVKTGFEVVKTFAPSIALAALGTASILYSHGLMKKREASLLAAYGILERAFDAYRDRVRATIGEDVEQQIYNGETMYISEVDQKGRTITWNPTKGGAPSGRSEYAVEFGPENRNWNSARAELNLVFLRAQERYANHLLQSRGHIFLNDIYDSIGMPRTPAGAVVGWLRDGKGDGYVDFELPEAGTPEEQDYFYFFDGEGPIFLDFNVDGLIFEDI